MTEHRRPASSVRAGFAREDWNARYAQKELLWTAEPNRLFAAELAQALRHAARAVAPGGTLVVLGHDTTNLSEGHGGPKDASVLFTPEDVVGELGGLVVERAEKVRRTVPLDDGEAVAIDAFVRARRPRRG